MRAAAGHGCVQDGARVQRSQKVHAGVGRSRRGGRLLPSLSADLYFAELLRWFGVSSGNMPYVLPNVANFWNPTSVTPPIGFVLP